MRININKMTLYILIILAILSIPFITALSYTSHFFNSVEIQLDYQNIAGGGHSPQGSILAVGGRYYESNSYYAGWVVVGDVSFDSPPYKLLKFVKSELVSTPPDNIYVTTVTAGDDGTLFVGGYGEYGSETRYFIAKLIGTPRDGYTLDTINYYSGVSLIMDMGLVNHPYYGNVLLVAAVDANGNYPVAFLVDPTDLSVKTAVTGDSLIFNQAGVNTLAASMDSSGSIILVTTSTNSQGTIVLFKWNDISYSYSQAYVIKYLNGLFLYDVATNEENDVPYAYIVAAKKYDSYTDWGTGSDLDPVLIKVDLSKLGSGDSAFDWVLIIDNDDDDNAYAVAIYKSELGSSGDRALLYGSLSISGIEYPLVGVFTPDGEVDSVAVVPAPSSSDSSRPRGEYYTGSVYEGYAFAMGTTYYSTDSSYFNIGLLLYSSQIADQLDWNEGAPSDWSPVTVLKDLTGVATITKRTDIQPSVDGPRTPTSLTVSPNSLVGVALQSSDPTVYTAEDSNTPEPVPEPWYLVATVVLVVFGIVLVYVRK